MTESVSGTAKTGTLAVVDKNGALQTLQLVKDWGDATSNFEGFLPAPGVNKSLA
jgi:hypothetical protein